MLCKVFAVALGKIVQCYPKRKANGSFEHASSYLALILASLRRFFAKPSQQDQYSVIYELNSGMIAARLTEFLGAHNKTDKIVYKRAQSAVEQFFGKLKADQGFQEARIGQYFYEQSGCTDPNIAYVVGQYLHNVLPVPMARRGRDGKGLAQDHDGKDFADVFKAKYGV